MSQTLYSLGWPPFTVTVYYFYYYYKYTPACKILHSLTMTKKGNSLQRRAFINSFPLYNIWLLWIQYFLQNAKNQYYKKRAAQSYTISSWFYTVHVLLVCTDAQVSISHSADTQCCYILSLCMHALKNHFKNQNAIISGFLVLNLLNLQNIKS